MTTGTQSIDHSVTQLRGGFRGGGGGGGGGGGPGGPDPPFPMKNDVMRTVISAAFCMLPLLHIVLAERGLYRCN